MLKSLVVVSALAISSTAIAGNCDYKLEAYKGTYSFYGAAPTACIIEIDKKGNVLPQKNIVNICGTSHGAFNITGGKLSLHKPSKTNDSKKCWIDGFVSLRRGELEIWEAYSQGREKIRFITGLYIDITGQFNMFNMIRISK